MWRLAMTVVVLALAAPAEAGKCKKGALLFRTTWTPIRADISSGFDEPSRPMVTVLEMRTTGRWWQTEDGARTMGGCLGASRLRKLKKAVARARFAPVEGATCRALPSHTVVHEGRKGKVETATPCGAPIDDGTATAAACLEAVLDPDATAATISQACAPP